MDILQAKIDKIFLKNNIIGLELLKILDNN